MDKYAERIDRTPTCHIWLGAINPYGYGLIFIEGKHKQAHRVAYEAVNGEIPQGMIINHLCRVRNCVNAEHLEATTHRRNILTGISPSAINSRKTHCKAGHEYNEANTRITPRGWRVCRICARKWH